nr:hypothetical protein [Tanacetum cinerariifolium]
MLIPETDDDVGAIIDDTYPNLLQNLWNPSFFQEKTILDPTHEMVDIINERMLSLLLGDENEYESSDSVCLADKDLNFDDSITTEFLNSLRMSGIPNHSIKLKIGTPIMLMRNINQRAGLYNGTRLQVLRLGINIIEAQIISDGSVGWFVFKEARIFAWTTICCRLTSKKQERIEAKVSSAFQMVHLKHVGTSKSFDYLIEKDKLHNEMKGGSVFQGMQEVLTTFPPTYEFERYQRV